MRERVTIGFGFTLIGWESGAKILNQSPSLTMQNQSKRELLLTLEWKPHYARPVIHWRHPILLPDQGNALPPMQGSFGQTINLKRSITPIDFGSIYCKGIVRDCKE